MASYDFVLLPPDAFHLTLRDRIADAERWLAEALDVIEELRSPRQRVLVKFRSRNQALNFPVKCEVRCGYGRLLEYCSPESVVIGWPGSGAWECLLHDIPFYSFWDARKYLRNRYVSPAAVRRLHALLHIACDKNSLRENIRHRRVFKPGKGKKDLLHEKGMDLHRIVVEILAGGRSRDT